MNGNRLISDKKHYEKTSNVTRKNEFLLVVIYFLPLVNYYLAEILVSFNLNTLSTYSYIVVYGSALYTYAYIIKKKPFTTIMVILALVFIFLVTYVTNEKTLVYMLNTSFEKSNLVFFWGLNLPLFLLTLLPINFKHLLKLAYIFSVVVLVLNIVSFLIKIYIVKPDIFNYMAFAYSALSSIFICFYCSIEYRKLIPLMISIVASIIIIIGGSRGALMTMVAFYLLYLIIVVKERTLKSVFVKVIVILTVSFLTLNFEAMVDILNYILSELGYNSRLLTIINGNSIFISSERNDIWNVLINEIDVIGHGLYGDRILAADFYAHNWVIELLVDFGVLLGSFAIISILFVIFRALIVSIKSKNNNLQFFIVCILVIFFVKLMLSASFLTSADFWLFLGLAYNISKYGSNSEI